MKTSLKRGVLIKKHGFARTEAITAVLVLMLLTTACGGILSLLLPVDLSGPAERDMNEFAPALETPVGTPTGTPQTEAPLTESPPTEATPTGTPPTESPPTESPPTGTPPTGTPPTESPPTGTPAAPTPDSPARDGENEPEGNAALSAFPFQFSAWDLYGNAVTESTIGEKQVFFVHLWGTWCAPCIQEMPDLAELAKSYGDRVGFLGLVDDFSNTSGAIRIIESADMPDSFIMIDAEEPSVRPILELVTTGYVPTTVFIYKGDAYGPLVGAYGEEYAIYLDALLDGEYD